MYKITFKVAPYFMVVSDTFKEIVSDDWRVLTKVVKEERIKNE